MPLHTARHVSGAKPVGLKLSKMRLAAEGSDQVCVSVNVARPYSMSVPLQPEKRPKRNVSSMARNRRVMPSLWVTLQRVVAGS